MKPRTIPLRGGRAGRGSRGAPAGPQAMKLHPRSIFMGVTWAYLISLVAFLFFGLLLALTGIPDTIMPGLSTATSGFSIFVGGFYAARRAGTAGWLNGAVAGAIYTVLLLVIGNLLIPDLQLTGSAITHVFLGIVAGTAGGVFGINA